MGLQKAQKTLFDSDNFDVLGGAESIGESFRNLYYYLYTNSEASRAERITSDLSLILLLKLASEVTGKELVADFISGASGSYDALLPTLKDMYPGLIDASDGFSMGEDAVRKAFAILSNVTLSTAPSHVLGDAFQALIGPRLRGEKGQFFTPRSIVCAMVRIVDPQPGESVLDPACGTGGFLSESFSWQLQRQKGPGTIVGFDKDQDLYRIASSLLHIRCRQSATVFNSNSLDPSTWIKAGLADKLFDVVLTNPPFGAKIPLRDKSILANFDLAYQWTESRSGVWKKTDVLKQSQDPQTLFLELCIRKLRPGGRLGIILPEGMFGNKRIFYVWEWIRAMGRVTALLDCPRTAFQPGTDTKTNVLFFERSESGTKQKERPIWVSVALNCGHDRRGRTHYLDGTSYPDNFASLGKPGSRNSDNWEKVTKLKFDYLVPRYYVHSSIVEDERALIEAAPRARLGELCSEGLITVRKGHEVGSHAYGTGDIPFIRTSDIANFEISTDPTNSVSQEVFDRVGPQQKLKDGDIVMVVDGRYRIGKTARLTKNCFPCIVQSHFKIISVCESAPFGTFDLMYALNMRSVRRRLRNLVFIQSTLGTLGSRLMELEIPIFTGDGLWRCKVEEFEKLIRNRDKALKSLREMTAVDAEI